MSLIKSESEKERREKISNYRATGETMENFPSSQSSQKIADIFNTNEKYVRDAGKYKTEKPEIFEAVKSGEKNWSARKIAERCGVGHVMVNSLRKSVSVLFEQIETPRIVERNGKIYEMNTTNIGKQSTEQSAAAF